MAQSKKSVSPSSSKRQATHKTSPKSAASSQKISPRAHREASFFEQAAPYLLAVVAVLFGVCVILGEGWVGEGVKNVLSGVFAGGAYLLPVCLLVRALLWKRDTEECQRTGRSICLTVVFVLITMLLHLLAGGDASLSVTTHYENGMAFIGGGAVGGILGQLLFMCMGKTGSLILLFAAAVLLSLYVAGLTPRGIYIFIAYQIRFAKEERAERREEMTERRSAVQSKNKIREEEYLAYLREKKRLAREADPRGEDNDYNPPREEQAINTEEPEVYRVKKKRGKKDPVKENDPVANALGVMESEEFATDAKEDGEQLTVYDQPIAEEVPAEPADEKIYDEVMRRTRERIGLSAEKDDGATYSVSANEDLDAVGVALRELHGEGSEEKNGDFDASKLFANPEDAAMIDRISEAANNPLSVKRETVSSPAPAPEKPNAPEYKFPPMEILAEDPGVSDSGVKEELQENAVKLVETLGNFNVRTKIENISRGPTITRYELLPEPGTRVRSIVNLVDDISLSLATTGVRIEAPIPGKSAVGIEVPNKKRATVHLRTLIEDAQFRDAKSCLTVCLGQNVAGENVYFDIGKMPHLLIAGATGSGKSVCLNSIITSILYKASPEDVKLILIDPKKVELTIYNGIPHLLVPVVSEPKKAAGSLSWAVSEMERRYGLIEAVGARDIKGYNNATKDNPEYEYMTRIVIIIDELADLMMTAPDDVEESICRIAQKARAAGMYLVIGTQRPSVDVITGLIKANIPSRIACRTSSQIDSRTIIDIGSAANLIGMGDMLFAPVGALKPVRVQGAYVSEEDVEEVVSYIKNMNAGETSYSDEIANQIEREAQRCGAGKKNGGAEFSEEGDGDEDPMLRGAIELAIESGKISTSLIQRRLSLGYGRAAKLIDRMEQLGYVSAPDGQKPRDVLISKQDYMEMRLKEETPFD